MLNALTIDVEEWFCVSNFERVIRREDWDGLESRVEMQTDRNEHVENEAGYAGGSRQSVAGHRWQEAADQ